MINDDCIRRDIPVTIRMDENDCENLEKVKDEYDLGTTGAIMKAVHNQFLEAKPIILRERPAEKVVEDGVNRRFVKNIRLNECDMDEVNYVMNSYGLSRVGAIRYSLSRENERISRKGSEENE